MTAVLETTNLRVTFGTNIAAVRGVSLTVNEVGGSRFGVNIIPHTQAKTTFGAAQAGARVNLEIDILARYVARLLGKDLA